MLADRAKVSLTALKRMESVNGLRVYESTADQMRRALASAGIIFINSGPHIGVIMDVSQLETQKYKSCLFCRSRFRGNHQ